MLISFIKFLLSESARFGLNQAGTKRDWRCYVNLLDSATERACVKEDGTRTSSGCSGKFETMLPKAGVNSRKFTKFSIVSKLLSQTEIEIRIFLLDYFVLDPSSSMKFDKMGVLKMYPFVKTNSKSGIIAGPVVQGIII